MVDRNYKVMRFFESWVGLVNPLYGTTSAATNNQTMTLNYPKKYKCDMAIAKFNKDYNRGGVVLLYQFNEAWPYSVASTPVNYQGGNILKLNVTFRYTRYFVYDVTTIGERFGRYGSSDSFNYQLGRKGRYQPRSLETTKPEPRTTEDYTGQATAWPDGTTTSERDLNDGLFGWLPRIPFFTDGKDAAEKNLEKTNNGSTFRAPFF
tara:strand:- start:56 stop:673 length:618 start_codon:yes stop_codon:yes gene_type:complete